MELNLVTLIVTLMPMRDEMPRALTWTARERDTH
jgi:hypothetical protein